MDRDGGILEDLSGNPQHGHPLSPRAADRFGHTVASHERPQPASLICATALVWSSEAIRPAGKIRANSATSSNFY
jgi:hypothetical protein